VIWLWLAAATMVATAIVHSVLGERRLITPILALDSDITRKPLARRVTRFAWHFTSALMALSATVVIWPRSPSGLVAVTGAVWIAVGLFDGVFTRGEHIGWPFLTAAGVFALVGALT
jgi:hypothetical protein